MGDQATNALVAIVLGSVVAVVLLVPTAAHQYRLDGRLQAKDLAVLLSGAVYGLSLWTYTLLPMPAPDSYRCRGRQLEPFGSISRIWTDVGAPDHTFQVGQVALNVLLFVPLGYYLRVIVRRGVVTAALVGLATSLLIELTQTTGVWNLYDCPYRLLDVDDLLVNTVGAVGGSLLSFVVLDRRDDTTPPLPSTVSLGRRLVGLASDVIFSVLLGGAAAAVYRGLTEHGPGDHDAGVRTAVLVGVPYVVQAVSVLAVGRTVGEHVVAVRAVPRAGGAARSPYPRRLVKLAAGATPGFALVAVAVAGAGWVATAALVGLGLLTVAHVVVAGRSEQHRGLSHVVAGLDLRIATEERLEREVRR
ncbi:VanZ family protein [Nocardioides dongxiaopingii]|uniref:VanZ family protein n=1 Tax=Nocardioides dongxiaopingii TaxID=2576036 RepID=UPI0010C762A2|nr:VanZ family protein [Nocardioides dongxiaopingii]